MISLILFVALAIIIVVLYEIRERQKAKQPEPKEENTRPDGCCGEHLVCEKETLLQTNAEIIYYDDEELDALAGIEPQNYTPQQYNAIRDIFSTLQERDVPGWCKSLQLRNIKLPLDIREEALLIVRERRYAADK